MEIISQAHDIGVDVNPIRHLVFSIVATGVVSATAITPAVAAPQVPQHTVAEVQAKVNAKVAHIVSHLAVLRPRVAANKRYTVAQKTLLDADIVAVLNAAVAARTKIDSDTTMDQIRADRPLLVALHDKRIKLKTDLAAARAH
ncbi:hypothetical protein [Krasilnikovia sp. MM14-A1259]|uniref:hypothetical protein n=1 Tax=Krasilnikovia sp. MM14-A1259 TaxID=3373539 RepID=UPI00380A2EF5